MANTISDYLSQSEKDEIVSEISKAELNTSGEIKIHIDFSNIKSSIDTAKKLFFKLGINKTINRNGVLLYINLKKNMVAIVGDEKIHDILGDSGWGKLVDVLLENFKKEKYKIGIVNTVREIGNILTNHFPQNKEEDNPDEIANDISF